MRVDVARDMGPEERQRELQALESRHRSFEALRQRVFVERCNDPGAEDDYVLWKALRDADTGVEERTTFETPEVFQALTPRRIELLEQLHAAPVNSVRELAEKLHRDYKNTYEDLVALQGWGLVSMHREGKNQRPSALMTSLRVSWEK